MPKINLLPKEISELIAAGEVIDRPCSVVKELLENSIDSGATSITVEIKNGGTTFIRISDNGCGIAPEDVSTAFLRHATSKIKDRTDLEHIFTLGFRGEALASIAAVAKVDVLTKQKGEQFGTHYSIEGGEEKLCESCGCPDGTTIVIRDIFYNVPARLKFLKKDVTEGNSIAAVVNKLSLSHPEISFKLIHDNRQDIFTPGDNELYSAIYAVFGKAFAETQIPVSYENSGIKVEGYAVKPLCAKANRTFQNFFVNGRFVKSVTCTVSLEEAYRNVIMTGKFPSCVLNISVPADMVDVNVHPAKTEVRFADEKLVFDSVFFAVKNAVMAYDVLEKEPPAPIKPAVAYAAPEVKVYGASDQLTLNSPKATIKNDSIDEERPIQSDTPVISELKPVKLPDSNFKYISSKSFERKAAPAPAPVEEKKLPEFRVVGEVLKTYIVVEADGSMLLIDKHAAHERILFEKLMSENAEFNSQTIVPQDVFISAEQLSALNENMTVVTELGFILEEKSGTELTVKGIPALLSDYSADELICEVADNLLLNKNNPRSKLIDELYHSIACKAAIKAHDKTDTAELVRLTAEVLGNDKIRYCPHGRPVVVVMTENDLEKQFKRVL